MINNFININFILYQFGLCEVRRFPALSYLFEEKGIKTKLNMYI